MYSLHSLQYKKGLQHMVLDCVCDVIYMKGSFFLSFVAAVVVVTPQGETRLCEHIEGGCSLITLP